MTIRGKKKNTEKKTQCFGGKITKCRKAHETKASQRQGPQFFLEVVFLVDLSKNGYKRTTFNYSIPKYKVTTSLSSLRYF
jgi:hypothetical protein